MLWRIKFYFKLNIYHVKIIFNEFKLYFIRHIKLKI